MRTPEPEPGRLAYSPSEVAKLIGKSRSFVYGEIAEGRLKARLLGTRRVVLDPDLRAYLASLAVVKPVAA